MNWKTQNRATSTRRAKRLPAGFETKKTLFWEKLMQCVRSDPVKTFVNTVFGAGRRGSGEGQIPGRPEEAPGTRARRYRVGFWTA